MLVIPNQICKYGSTQYTPGRPYDVSDSTGAKMVKDGVVKVIHGRIPPSPAKIKRAARRKTFKTNTPKVTNRDPQISDE